MEIPQIPTDNLYKFLALFGIIVIAASLVLPVYFNHQIQIQAIQVQAEADAIDLEISGETVVQQVENRSTNAASYIEQTRRMDQLQIKRIRAEGKVKEAEFLKAESQRLMVCSKWGVGLGIVICLVGFVLWYVKLQRWQDADNRARCKAGKG